jgi:tRNA (guanine37-N1)-methyltransferase
LLSVAVVTLFPELFGPLLETSFVGRAIAGGKLKVHLENLREHGLGKHRSVDDTPYGGGSGMVMRVDCIVSAMEAAALALGSETPPCRVLLTPQGQPLRQALAADLSARSSLVLVCGRYEGFDERVRSFVDLEVSLGDFVMTGGEVAAMAILEATVRLIPGVLGNAESTQSESFSPACGGLLEYPQYTRPANFRGLDVPEVLKGGNHAEVEAFRRAESLERTRERRPDLVPETVPQNANKSR